MRLRELLQEAVFIETPEQALVGYIQRAPSGAVKAWLVKNFWNWAKKDVDSLHLLTFVPPGATEAQKTAFAYKDLYDFRMSANLRARLDHMMDWFNVNPEPPRLERMTPEQVEQAANRDMERANKRAEKTKGQEEPAENLKTMMEFPGGYKMVELLTQPALDREGNLMGHCIGAYHGNVIIGDKSHRGFSLRDSQNMPHATIEMNVDGNHTTEVKGKRNLAPVRRYWGMIWEFLQKYQIQLVGDAGNIGMIMVADAKGVDRLMSLDEFKDLIQSNPEYEKSEAVTAYPNENYLFGLFNAYYGTDKLNDELIRMSFNKIPDSAISVIEHHGNKLTPEQCLLALKSLTTRWARSGKEQVQLLLDALKPNRELIEYFLADLPDPDPDGSGGIRLATTAITPAMIKTWIISGLAENNPQLYFEMVNIDEEMECGSWEREVAPYWATLKTKKEPTLEMAYKAFRTVTDSALKNTKSLSGDAILGAYMGGLKASHTHTDEETYKSLTEKFPLTTALAKALIKNPLTESPLAKCLLKDERFKSAWDQKEMESLAMKGDDTESFEMCLDKFPKASVRVQLTVFNATTTGKKAGYGGEWKNLLKKISHYEPGIWKRVVDVLRPEAIDPKTKRWISKKQKNVIVDKDPKDINKEKVTNARVAIDKFTQLLGHMLFKNDKDLSMDAAKVKEAQAAFAETGRERLLKTGLRRVARDRAHRMIQSSNRDTEDRSRMFVKYLKILSDIDVVWIISTYWGHGLFTDLINNAPERFPGVIEAGLKKGKSELWGLLDHKRLNKEKMFTALEHVWSHPLPEIVVDALTLRVFKRFKPSAAKLIDMLTVANDPKVTRYMLKKTKKPKDDLMNFAFKQNPRLFLELSLDQISDQWLAKLFTKSDVINSMIKRDLRGYDLEKNWRATKKGIDQTGEEYAKYRRAAIIADKAQWFDRHVRGAGHEDNWREWQGGEDNTEARLKYIKTHAEDMYNSSLVKAGNSYPGLVPWMFDNLPSERVARLLSGGMTRPNTWSDDEFDYTPIPKSKLIKVADELSNIMNKKDLDIINKINIEVPIPDGIKKKIVKRYLEQREYYNVSNLEGLIEKSTPEFNDWIAKNHPDLMVHCTNPTRGMVEALFKNYGKISKSDSYDDPEKKTINHTFTAILRGWFEYGKGNRGGGYHMRRDPELEQMLREVAFEIGGLAPAMLKRVMKGMIDGESRHSSPGITPLTKIRPDQLSEALRLLV